MWSSISASSRTSGRRPRPIPQWWVDDLDGLAGRLEAAGQDATWDAEFPGHRRIYATDPFGNRLEFLQPL